MRSTNLIGVTAYGRKFRAQLNRMGRVFYLGVFPTVQQAAQAYDRGSVLSEAWSKRMISLNFPRPSEALQPTSDEEVAMMVHLRTFYSQIEKDHLEHGLLISGVPNDTLDSIKRTFDNLGMLCGNAQGFLVDLRDSYLRAQGKIMQLEAKLKFSDETNARLMMEKEQPALKAGWTMKKVVPLPAEQPPEAPANDTSAVTGGS